MYINNNNNQNPYGNQSNNNPRNNVGPMTKPKRVPSKRKTLPSPSVSLNNDQNLAVLEKKLAEINHHSEESKKKLEKILKNHLKQKREAAGLGGSNTKNQVGDGKSPGNINNIYINTDPKKPGALGSGSNGGIDIYENNGAGLTSIFGDIPITEENEDLIEVKPIFSESPRPSTSTISPSQEMDLAKEMEDIVNRKRGFGLKKLQKIPIPPEPQFNNESIMTPPAETVEGQDGPLESPIIIDPTIKTTLTDDAGKLKTENVEIEAITPLDIDDSKEPPLKKKGKMNKKKTIIILTGIFLWLAVTAGIVAILIMQNIIPNFLN